MRNFLLIICTGILLSACTSTRDIGSASAPLLTIGDSPVLAEEFYYVYNKNSNNTEVADKRGDIEEYLNLFINFKLKVKEAEALGLDQQESFKQELAGYRSQLAKPFLTESKVTDQLVEEAYQRLKQEINASHILVNLMPDAEPEDTLMAYQKIMSIREQAVAGENFDALAKQYSQDPSAASNGGNLGYFTALQMVYPFEDAAYKTAEGDISMPVRTRFGYHIIRVNDKRQSKGKVKVSHIMVRATEGLPVEDSLAARNKIFELHSRVINGGNWDELVTQFSDDLNTKAQGGLLPWISTGNLIPSFEDAAFVLAKSGDISAPVKTPYGWHIIRLEEKKGLEPLEEISENLKGRVSKDSRSELNKAALIKRLKSENNVVEYPDHLALAAKAAESVAVSWLKVSDTTIFNLPLFKINDEVSTVKDFFSYAEKQQKPNGNAITKYQVNRLYQDHFEKILLAYEESHLAEKYEEFRLLENEYREGILLFQLMDEKVWSKALLDTVGLRQFFAQNQDKYKWDERADATIFSLSNKELIAPVKAAIDEHGYSDSLAQAITSKLNSHEVLSVQYERGLYEKSQSEMLKAVPWAAGTYTIEKNDRVFYILIHNIVSGTLKELDDIRGLVISDYQNHLEKEWVRSLKEQYQVDINEKVLDEVYERFEVK